MKTPDIETLTLFRLGESMKVPVGGQMLLGRANFNQPGDVTEISKDAIQVRLSYSAGKPFALAAALFALILAAPAGFAQDAGSPPQSSDSVETGEAPDGADAGTAKESLPDVDVKTRAVDDTTVQPAQTPVQDDDDDYADYTPPPAQDYQPSGQATAQSSVASATALADRSEDTLAVGPTSSGDQIRGLLGTGTTDVDGYVAGASSTFTKTNTRIQDVPQSVSIVTKDQFQDQGHESLGQTLQFVPGVTVQQGEGHRDHVTIRGQETTADFFTDGVRDDIQYYRDLYNIEAVEVLKGPAALIFGRGGGGGIINRVTKKAEWRDIREASINFGMYERKRVTMDVGTAVNENVAIRLNAMYEDSEGFRDYFDLERYGFNPTVAIKLSPRTLFRASYQYHTDDRTVDRGVPSVAGTNRPIRGFQDTFFGNPNLSYTNFDGHVATATLDHHFLGGLKFRQHVSYNNYDKFYQNLFPTSSVDAAGNFNIGGYYNDTDRESFFSQTDFSYKFASNDFIRHTVAFGADFSWSDQINTRFTPTFQGGGGTLQLNVANPTSFVPAQFATQTRDRRTDLTTQGFYIQDQIEITKYFEVIAGVRFDRFDLDFLNGQNGARAARVDEVWSPRVGAVFKPIQPLSFYASWSKSFLPSAGDQFDNLTGTSEDFEPEEFENREIGFKWELAPRLFLTGALFELDRTNQPVTVNAFNVTSGATETRGGELGLTGYLTDKWQVNLGYANLRSEIVNNGDNLNGQLGNSVDSVPRHQFSLWNRYQFTQKFGAGIGVIHLSDYFANVDNTVVVPSFTRVDAALYYDVNENWSAQLNVENLFDTDYFSAAHTNDNISPGAPLSAYATIRARF